MRGGQASVAAAMAAWPIQWQARVTRRLCADCARAPAGTACTAYVTFVGAWPIRGHVRARYMYVVCTGRALAKAVQALAVMMMI